MYQTLSTFRCFIFLLAFSFAGSVFSQTQTITIGTIDPGPYAAGSSIAVPITIADAAGSLLINNRFDLYLSDATGDFTAETKIGEYDGFYTTFVNGIIPPGTVASPLYKVRVKSIAPSTISAASAAIAIIPGTGVTAELTSSQTISTNPRTFGVCTNGNNGTVFTFSNNSTPGAVTTATFKNELTGVTGAPISFVTPSQDFTAAPAHYTIITKAVSGGITGTRAYFLINNRTLTSFSTTGVSSVCLPAQDLEYGADVQTSNGLQNNFPGNTYRVQWGDGNVNIYTLDRIKAAGNKVSHKYTSSSCGFNISVGGIIEAYDVFNIIIQPLSAFCNGNSGGSLSFRASAVSQPENRIFYPSKACITDPVTFVNFSDPGQIPGSGNAACSNPDARYAWYVDGTLVTSNQPLSFNLVYSFTTTGIHTIRLESSNTGPCSAAPVTRTICISQPPQPSFSLPGNGKMCLQTQIQPVNTTFIDNNGCSSYRYLWTITGPAPVAYQSGDDQNSAQPRFEFTVPGSYNIKLKVTVDSVDSVIYACRSVETPVQTVIVNDIPVAAMAADLSVCGMQTFTFNDTPGSKTRTTFSGTFQEEADTYTWSVSGGAFAYANNTNSNSKYPSIEFLAFATYMVTVVHTNNCGSTTASQQVIVNNSPSVTAGIDKEVCYGLPFALNGSISDMASILTTQWIGGNGTFSDSDDTNPNAIYTPSQDELDSGYVKLTLRVTTTILQPCDTILATVTIRFVTNTFTSAPGKTICTGSPVNYQPATSLPGSTFTWTSVASSGINGNTDNTGSPGPGLINDVLINTGTSVGTVTYTITPHNPSCDGDPFTLTVTVLPEITNNIINAAVTTICSGQQAVITGVVPAGGNGTYSYNWEFSTDSLIWNPIPSSNTENLSFSITVTSWFRRTVSSGPCSQTSNSVKIIAQPPIASNTISGNESICPGATPALFNGSIPTGGDGTYTYQWQKSENNGQLWTDIPGATGQDYQSAGLTVTTRFRRIARSTLCNGPQQNVSAEITVAIHPLPVADFTFTSDLGCAPFNITAQNIKAIDYPAGNNMYIWYVDNVQIGNANINFPGYTITDANKSVVIKLIVTSKFGCVLAEMSHTFKSIDFVTASFTQNFTQGCGPLTVQFNNSSTPINGATYSWDFGNGQTFSGANPNPVTFQVNPNGKDTTYVIQLKATTACTSDTFTSTVLVKAKPRSVFSPNSTLGCSPFTVSFSNTSPSTSATYHYDFGDGSPVYTTTSKDPVTHVYTVSGGIRDFIVKMTAENECGSDVTQYSIRTTPHMILPELVVNSNEKEGCGPLTVRFFNNSKNASSFIYDFGDGSPEVISNTSPEMIVHTFTKAGNFLVKLKAINSCSDTTTTETITVFAQPEAAFTANTTKGCTNLSVKFTNNSVNGFQYLWDFGDGSTSTDVNPTHVFTDAKTFYTIKLITTNILGCRDTSVLTDYINIVPIHANFDILPFPEIALPDFTFHFTDRTDSKPVLWQWDFGDGSKSTSQNPSHTYADTGRYVVKLIAHTQEGCSDSLSKPVRITGIPGYLFVANSFMPGSASPELQRFTIKGSGIEEWAMRIFNKWGEVIWETSKLQNGSPVESWDGTINGSPAPQGVYFWTVSLKMSNGIEWKGMSYNGSPPKRTGVIHLLR